MPRRRSLRYRGAVPAVPLTAFLYTDAGEPTLTTKYGFGNLSNGRVDFRLGGSNKYIIVDGTTSTNGIYRHVANIAAAKSAFAAGDWILFPSGGSQASVFGEFWTGGAGFNGTSAQNMAVLGTFTVGQEENAALYNKGPKYTVDGTGTGAVAIAYCNHVINYFALVNFAFVTGDLDMNYFQFVQVDSSYLYFENCTFDGIQVNMNAGNVDSPTVGYAAQAISSLTNPVGTTARAFTTNTTYLQVGMKVAILGATPTYAMPNPASYGGWVIITAINAGVSFDYEFAGNGGVAATGTMYWTLATTSMPDSACLRDVTFRYCGFMYGNSPSGGRSAGPYMRSLKRGRFEECINFHCGWSRGQYRSTPAWADPAQASSTLTNVGTLATFNCTDTRLLANGDVVKITGASPAAYNGTFVIGGVVADTRFTYTMLSDPGGNASVQGSFGAWDATLQSGPDQYKHSYYIAEYVDGINFMNCVVGWDASNPKFTGAPYIIQNFVTIRNPIAYIAGACGNHYGSWYEGAVHKDNNALVVGSDDINYVSNSNGARGRGPSVNACTTGSYIKDTLIVNNNNRDAVNRLGVTVVNGGAVNYSTVMLVDGMQMGTTWLGAQDPNTTPDGTTTLTFSNNVWGTTATSGTNKAVADLSAPYQAAIAVAEARTANTLVAAFPLYLSGVTVDADVKVTETNLFEYMCENLVDASNDPIPWCALFHYHWRQPLAAF